ncbi:hypothetical protein HAALTHF_48340n [Vreelandella aquamarina]|nr:hypothetical protein HAALTHF_48340n [Halomonas axialensis]
MVIIDPLSDRLIDANTAACQLLLIHEQPLTTPFSHRLSASLPLWVSFTDEVLTTGQGWSDDLVLLDSVRQPRHVEVYGKRLHDSSKLLLTVIDRNKAEQRRAKAELSRQHRQGGGGLAASRAGVRANRKAEPADSKRRRGGYLRLGCGG